MNSNSFEWISRYGLLQRIYCTIPALNFFDWSPLCNWKFMLMLLLLKNTSCKNVKDLFSRWYWKFMFCYYWKIPAVNRVNALLLRWSQIFGNCWPFFIEHLWLSSCAPLVFFLLVLFQSFFFTGSGNFYYNCVGFS